MLDTVDAPLEADQSTARYFNRELSWLAFNRRVLEESENLISRVS